MLLHNGVDVSLLEADDWHVSLFFSLCVSELKEYRILLVIHFMGWDFFKEPFRMIVHLKHDVLNTDCFEIKFIGFEIGRIEANIDGFYFWSVLLKKNILK